MRDSEEDEEKEKPERIDGGSSLWDRELPRVRFRALNALGLLSVTLVLVLTLAPNFVRARAQGRMSACPSNLKNISTALEMYSQDWEGSYPTTLQALTPNYLRVLPQCPVAQQWTYRAYFGSAAPLSSVGYQDYYYVECHGENHKASGIEGNYPAYNSVQGLIPRRP